MDIVVVISSCFKRNRRVRDVRVLAVLEHMFHGSCRKKAKAYFRLARALYVRLP